MTSEDKAASEDLDRACASGVRRCGFIAILGAPNVGKSTLVNRLVGTKVTIVSPKVQTTRSRVLGIALVGASQVLLVDTPGLFQPRQGGSRRLDQAMVEAAWEGARGADGIALVVDATRKTQEGTDFVVAWLRQHSRRAVLLLNKIDAVDKARLLALTRDLDATGVFTRVFMVSALTGDGVGDVADWLASAVPEGPWLYPEDQASDMPTRMLAAEITREKLFWQLQQELPYSIAVETETWTENADGSIRLEQVIYVEREAQRGIVIGKGGQRIKQVGQLARREIEEILDCRVHLFLFVKIRQKWRDDPGFFRLHGLAFPPRKPSG
ncbi:MAG: GTPase Era [Rhodospirillales bacterium]|nr:GTPase Era [Rhodospirillales bacterium]